MDCTLGLTSDRYWSTGWGILRQSEVSTIFMVIAHILGHQPLEVLLIQDDHMVEQVSSATPDPAFRDTGSFRLGAAYSVAVFPFYAATASFRHNGILDLVFNDKLSDDVWVMLGNGDGTFQPPAPNPINSRFVGQPYLTGLWKVCPSSARNRAHW